MDTIELTARLRRHYIKPGPMPGGVFVTECGLNNGSSRQARVDALHIGFTSTSGRILRGHELKVSRADWLAELAKVGKADVWADQCHEWWLVTPDASIVADGELPPGWGHMVVDPRTKTRLKVLVPAQRKPEGFTPSWLALRSIMARLDTLMQQERAQMAYEEGQKARAEAEKKMEERLASRAGRRLTPEEQTRLAVVDKVESELGMTLTFYRSHLSGDDTVTPQEFATAVRVARALHDVRDLAGSRLGYTPYALARQADDLEATAKNLRALAATLNELATTPIGAAS